MIDRSRESSACYQFRTETLQSPEAMRALQSILDQDTSVAEIWTAVKIRDSLAIPGTLLRIALSLSGDIGGFYLVRCIFETMELFYIYVAPSMRQRGLGRWLMEDLRTQALQTSEVQKVFLEVRPSNQPAIKLYEAFGFKSRTLRRKYYADGEDARIYEWEVVH